VLFGAGFAGVLGATAGYFAANGALSAMLEAVLFNGLRYSGINIGALLTVLHRTAHSCDWEW
jgi:hypothetical protein